MVEKIKDAYYDHARGFNECHDEINEELSEEDLEQIVRSFNSCNVHLQPNLIAKAIRRRAGFDG